MKYQNTLFQMSESDDMNQLICLKELDKKKLSRFMMIVISSFVSCSVLAEELFDPSFFEDQSSGIQVSDLSKFNQQNYQVPGIYRVDIMLNRNLIKTQDLNFLEKSDDQGKEVLFPCLSFEEIKALGVQLMPSTNPEDDHCVDFLSRIPASSSRFDFNTQRLYLDFPQASLNTNAQDYISPERWDSGIHAFYSNYLLSAYKTSRDSNKSLFINFDNGINLGSWQFRNNATFSYNTFQGQSNSTLNSLNSYVRKNIIPIKSTMIIGEHNSDSDIFESIQYRGLSMHSSEDMYPNSQQGYAPTVRGIAKTNANVVIKQSGYIIYQINVSPGPFVIDDLNPTSVSGDLDVEVQESDGTMQNFSIPYSTLPLLQREGRTKYSVVMGKNRNYAKDTKSIKFAQASLMHGLPNRISIYGGSQLSSDYQSVVFGLGQNLGSIGAFSFDITNSNSKMSDGSSKVGQSLRFLYAKSLIRTGTTFRLLGYRYSTENFFTFSEAMALNPWRSDLVNQDIYPTQYSKKGEFEANISHSFSQKYGSLFLSANEQSYWGISAKDRHLQAGYSNTFKDLSYNIFFSSIQYGAYAMDDKQISASFSLPLSVFFRNGQYRNHALSRANVSSSVQNSSMGGTSFNNSLSGTALADRNLSYSINRSDSDRNASSSISSNYIGRYGSLGGTYSQNSQYSQLSMNARGSALLHKDGITFSQYLNGTGVLVDVQDAPNIAITNVRGLKTDWRGFVIVPFATAYRENRIALDTTTLADDVEVENNVATTVPIMGAITRVSFKPRIGIRALISLTHQGKTIPFASTVTEETLKLTGMVDSGGDVYLSGLPTHGQLKVSWGPSPDEQCMVEYDTSSMQKSSIYIFNAQCNENSGVQNEF